MNPTDAPAPPTPAVGAHIVATGLRCSVGSTAPSAAAAIRAGVSQLAEHPILVDTQGDKIFCGSDPALDPKILGAERIARLAEWGLREVAEKLLTAKAWPRDLVLLLALPEPRPGFDEADAARIAASLASMPLGATRSIHVERYCAGHAGALLALRAAAELVTSGRRPLVIVGGVDSYLEPSTIEWLDSQLRLARPGVRSGFPPGEGVALLAVTNDAICRRLRLRSLARLRGVACTEEHRDPTSDTGLLGEALAQAVLAAARGLQLPQETITDVYGDINGELARSHDWGFALLRTAGSFRDGTDYVSAAGLCGDVGAATGALSCVLATEAWRSNRAYGPRALAWAGSWGGLRSAALLEHEPNDYGAP